MVLSEATKTSLRALLKPFDQALRAANFSKRGFLWARPQGEVVALVDIQRKTSGQDQIDFTSNWALFVPGYAEVAWGRDSTPRVETSVLSGRLGGFSPSSGGDRWWTVSNQDCGRAFPAQRLPCDEVENEVVNLLVDRCLPFLAQYTSISSVIELLTNRHRIPPVAALNFTFADPVEVLARLRDTATGNR